ncbi:MAG TPA: hypothetical protein PLS39_04075 [Accumulibacter sp.]|nr:hypothetical protein [Accumulibacter sp.]
MTVLSGESAWVNHRSTAGLTDDDQHLKAGVDEERLSAVCASMNKQISAVAAGVLEGFAATEGRG